MTSRQAALERVCPAPAYVRKARAFLQLLGTRRKALEAEYDATRRVLFADDSGQSKD